MKKYRAIPEPPIAFEAIQYTTDFDLISIEDKCKKINNIGKNIIEFFIKDDVLYVRKTERYVTGFQYTMPIVILSYLIFLEDDLMVLTEEEFKEDYEEIE